MKTLSSPSVLSVLSILSSACLISSGANPPEFEFRAVEVDAKVEVGYGVTVADVNGDRKPDILLADKQLIVWYENPSWQKHVIAEKLTPRDHVCLAAADIDGDGKAEVAVGAEWNPGDTRNSGAVFYLVAPADRTQKWEPIKLPHEPTTHRMRWVRNWQNEFDLVVVPLHGRGNNPGSGEGEGVRILAYRRPANPRDEWATRQIDGSLHKTHNFDPVQWDDDVAQELLIGGKEGVFVSNWVDGQMGLKQLAGNEGGGAGEVRAGRLPGGKRFFATVEPMHGNSVVVYTEAPAEGPWSRRVINETVVDGHAVACGDLAKAGHDQLVVGWRAMNRPGVKVGIKLYTPLDNQGKEWRQTLVDDNTMACEDLCLADLDGNGRLDIVAAGRATKNLKVYFNTLP